MGANGSSKCTKKRSFAKKCRQWFGLIIYSIFSLSAPSQTLLFHTSRPLKCTSAPRGASDAAPGLQNGAPGAEKWREWSPSGSPRVPKGLPMPPEMLPKIVQNQHPSPGLPPRVLPGCLGYPAAPKIPPFLMFSRPALPHVRGTFTSPLPLSATPHSVPRANVKHPSSAAVWAYAHLNYAYAESAPGFHTPGSPCGGAANYRLQPLPPTSPELEDLIMADD